MTPAVNFEERFGTFARELVREVRGKNCFELDPHGSESAAHTILKHFVVVWNERGVADRAVMELPVQDILGALENLDQRETPRLPKTGVQPAQEPF